MNNGDGQGNFLNNIFLLFNSISKQREANEERSVAVAWRGKEEKEDGDRWQVAGGREGGTHDEVLVMATRLQPTWAPRLCFFRCFCWFIIYLFVCADRYVLGGLAHVGSYIHLFLCIPIHQLATTFSPSFFGFLNCFIFMSILC